MELNFSKINIDLKAGIKANLREKITVNTRNSITTEKIVPLNGY